MQKDPKIFLQHIFNSITLIEEYAKGVSEETFRADIGLQDKLVHRVGIIGEAAKNISDDFRVQHPQIPWRKITGTRDYLIHEYFRIDLNLLWEIVQKEIPDLKEKISVLLKDPSGRG